MSPQPNYNVLEGIGDGRVQEGLVKGLRKLSPLLQPAFRAWWETGIVPDVGPYHDYKLSDLIIERRHGKTSGVADGFVAMNELLADPKGMTEHLQNMRYDHII